MKQGINLENHIALTCSDSLKEITRPLFNIFGITYFNYVKIYKNSGRILLTDRPDWIEYFYKNCLYNTNIVAKLEHQDKYAFHLWHEFNGQPSFIIGKEKFNIDNGITIVEPNKEYNELYYFGSTSDNSSVISLYLNNLDIFERFILFFKDKAHSLIQEAEQHKIFLPKPIASISNDSFSDNNLNQKIENFFNETPIERFFINEKLGIYLTKREAACLFLLLECKTAKEIGKILGISNRTVESYLESVKIKLGLNTKKQLIQISTKLGLHKSLANGIKGNFSAQTLHQP